MEFAKAKAEQFSVFSLQKEKGELRSGDREAEAFSPPSGSVLKNLTIDN